MIELIIMAIAFCVFFHSVSEIIKEEEEFSQNPFCRSRGIRG